MEKQRIFFDMDGILAVFNKNATMEEVFSKGYFENLRPMKSTISVMKQLYNEGYDIYILSSAREDFYQEKINWVKRWISPFIPDITEKIILVPLGENKSNYIKDKQKTDVLIDDYMPNLRSWHGIAVKGINGINSYTEEFDCVDLSFYEHYENNPTEYIDEIRHKIKNAVREIKFYAEREPLEYISAKTDSGMDFQNKVDFFQNEFEEVRD